MRVAVAQLNPTIGDLPGNVDKLTRAMRQAAELGAELVVASELVLTGYPPRDLLDRPAFIRDALATLRELVASVRGPALLVGAIVSHEGDPLVPSGRISNGAVLAADGAVVACHRKNLLPTYDVFDEARYFTPGRAATVVQWRGRKLGLSVCEDIWNDKDYWRSPRYDHDPVADEVAGGADLLINISASPYDRAKPLERSQMLQAMARRHRRPVLYVNQCGGNDSLVFDGRSVALAPDGSVGARVQAFDEAVALIDIDDGVVRGPMAAEPSCWEADVLEALTLGLRDYVRKCGFASVVLGLSGGIDSALTAAIAVRALGPERVIGVAMPSRYSSQGAHDDAAELARRLGIRMDVVPIEPIFQAYLDMLAEPFAGLPADVTEENLQARIRGALLMAYSNKLGSLLLTTGNKSELAVGYSTLYGDMCGGLAVISDVYKTDVYALARHINATGGLPIPQSSIDKAPSAELRPDQRDEDSLPPYELLDAALRCYIDEALGYADLLERGFSPELSERIISMVDRAEYKRRQMPPGLRVTRKAFGEGRRLPIAQRYRMRRS